MNSLLPNKILLLAATALFLSGCAATNTSDDDECTHEAGVNKSEQHACKAGAGCNQQHNSQIK